MVLQSAPELIYFDYFYFLMESIEQVCTQTRGEVIFVPQGFSYATVNNGLTIGIGGSAFPSTEERLSALKLKPTACSKELQPRI